MAENLPAASCPLKQILTATPGLSLVYRLLDELQRLYGARHSETCLRVYADSEGPDQPAHLRNPTRAGPSLTAVELFDITECMN